MNGENYRQDVLDLSKRIIAAQAPIRILDAIKWDDEVQQKFFAADCRCQPEVDVDYYRRNPLKFDVPSLHDTFRDIDRSIVSTLGTTDPAGSIMRRMCQEYRQVLDMLSARGTAGFSFISQSLYGRSRDNFHTGGPTVFDLGALLDEALSNIDERMFLEKDVKDIPTKEAIGLLQERLNRVFIDPGASVRVIESDGIVADAAAGSDYIKLRANTFFSERDLRALEAHEGWVHVCTTLNGSLQPVCAFLSKGTPSDTVTQEGLAVFTELVSFNSHPARLRRISDRIHAIALAEQGATFLDIFNRLRDEGRGREDAYTITMRVFRGSVPDGGPFTKDLAYSAGFVDVYNFIRLAVRRGQLDRIRLLFCGKLAIKDMGTLAQLSEEGVVVAPRYLPPPLIDISALTAWMAYSNFLNRLDIHQIDIDFAHLLD